MFHYFAAYYFKWSVVHFIPSVVCFLISSAHEFFEQLYSWLFRSVLLHIGSVLLNIVSLVSFDQMYVSFRQSYFIFDHLFVSFNKLCASLFSISYAGYSIRLAWYPITSFFRSVVFLIWSVVFHIQSVVCFIRSVMRMTFSNSSAWNSISCMHRFLDQLCVWLFGSVLLGVNECINDFTLLGETLNLKASLQVWHENASKCP